MFSNVATMTPYPKTEDHCYSCKSRTFKGLENFCTKHGRIIQYDRWLEQREDGKMVCWCGQHENMFTKKEPIREE